MKGIILAGGTGSRLFPCSTIINKHLLNVGRLPMIEYPLRTLIQSGIKDIIIVTSPEHLDQLKYYLGSGYGYGITLSYIAQDKPKGLAHAIKGTEHLVKGEPITVILGDNYFEDDFRDYVSSFTTGAMIFLKHVENPQDFGVAAFDDKGRLVNIIEKPKEPEDNSAAITGIYIYNNEVFEMFDNLKLSKRGEYEISDINKLYLGKNKLQWEEVYGYWNDCGTFDGLFAVSKRVMEKSE